MRISDKCLKLLGGVPEHDPPPTNTNAAQLGDMGGAARSKSKKAQRLIYRPLPHFLQAGGAR